MIKRARIEKRWLMQCMCCCVWLLLCAKAHAQDYPPVASNLYTFPAGSYVIPMDNDKQALNGEPFNLSAYGLIYQLLDNGVPLNWVMKAGKAKDEVDFTASAHRIFPSSTGTFNIDFRASAFIIDSLYVNEIVACGSSSNLQVDGTIQNFGNDVAVYQLDQSATVDVRYTLTNAPVIAILDDGGFSETGYEILEYASIPYDLLSYNEFSANNACYTFITQPHLSANDADSDYVTSIENFVTNGGNFLAQCAAIEAYEELALFLSLSGCTYYAQSILPAPLVYENNDMPVMQFEGNAAGFGVGSTSHFSPDAGFQAYAYGGVAGTNEDNNTSYIVAAGDLNGATLGGNIFYLGGHSYTPQQEIVGGGGGGNSFTSDVIESYNLNRVALNAMFVPASWASPCVASDQCICIGESVLLGCGNAPNIPYTWSPSATLNCADCTNPMAAPNATTTYTATTAGGCASAQITITIDCPISNTIAANDTTICPGDCAYIFITTDIEGTPTEVLVDGSTYNYGELIEVCPAANTTYEIVLTDSDGDTFDATATITVLPLTVPPVNYEGFCEGEEIEFTTASITAVQWASAALLSCTSCNATSVVLAENFSITVSGLDANNCAASNTVDIEVVPLPAVIVNDATVCDGQSTNLQATGADNYLWVQSNTSGSSYTFIPDETMTVEVQGTTDGCSSSAFAQVTVLPVQEIILVDSIALCDYDSCVILVAEYESSQVQWYTTGEQWIGEGVDITVCPSFTTSYLATTEEGQCFLPDTVMVQVIPTPDVYAGEDFFVCPGQPLPVDPTGADEFHWYAYDGENWSEIPTSSGLYSDQMLIVYGETTLGGCTASDSLFVTIYPSPDAAFSMSSEPDFFTGNPVYFTNMSTGADYYHWNFGMNSNSVSTEQNPVYTYSSAGYYIVTLDVYNEYGCGDQAADVVIIPHEFFYYVPNSFSPNADGVNDEFSLDGMGIADENFELTIYNRWGEKIYTITRPDDVWTGGYKDDGEYYVPDGVYVWQLKLMDDLTKLRYEDQGHLTILR